MLSGLTVVRGCWWMTQVVLPESYYLPVAGVTHEIEALLEIIVRDQSTGGAK
jgi:hypothetical protein